MKRLFVLLVAAVALLVSLPLSATLPNSCTENGDSQYVACQASYGFYGTCSEEQERVRNCCYVLFQASNHSICSWQAYMECANITAINFAECLPIEQQGQ